jgi:DNA-binding ferritin-like protein
MSISVGKFIGILLSSREQAHVFHLTTSSYATHKAMQKYYEDIVELIDSYAEAYMGRSKKRLTGLAPYINRRIITDPRFTRTYFAKLIRSLRDIKLPKDSALENIQQEINELIIKTIYALSLR